MQFSRRGFSRALLPSSRGALRTSAWIQPSYRVFPHIPLRRFSSTSKSAEITELERQLSEVQTKLLQLRETPAEAKVTEEKEGEPTRSQLLVVFAVSATPMVAFGLLDNAVMIVAGEYFEIKLGATFAISTMAAAGMGNLVSDLFGYTVGGVVEDFFDRRLNVDGYKLTPEQHKLKFVKWLKFIGGFLGLALGCIIGLFPLLFYDPYQSKLKKTFNAMDKDQDGFINRSELKKAFQGSRIRISEQQMDAVMLAADSNSDGGISLDEFVAVHQKWDDFLEQDDVAHTLTHLMGLQQAQLAGIPDPYLHRLKKTFSVMDIDGDGYISRLELKRAFDVSEMRISEQQMDSVMAASKSDPNKGISYDAFVKMHTMWDDWLEQDEIAHTCTHLIGLQSSQRAGIPDPYKARLSLLFKAMDLDQDGYLSRKELTGTFIRSRVNITEDQMTKVLEAAGSDPNKGISYDAFVDAHQKWFAREFSENHFEDEIAHTCYHLIGLLRIDPEHGAWHGHSHGGYEHSHGHGHSHGGHGHSH